MADNINQKNDIVLMTNMSPIPDAGTEPSVGEERWVGRVLDGRYRIVRVLGRGGMGVVLLARQTPIDRTVVVKVLSRRLMGDEVARVRFEREAQSLSKLKHPNIVTMHDFGYDSGLPFIVMEFVEGETLARVMQRRRRLKMRRFFPLAVQILAAIGAAHRMGWVHRDLKPDNIMITPREGQPEFVKVLDFGLARMLSTEDDITKQNLMGTALYLSPEQIQGHKVDQRADVYALGILFYLLLTGRRPFKSRDDVNLMFQHLSAPPEPLVKMLPEDHDVPGAVIELVHRCLDKDPKRRPYDATELLRVLIEASDSNEHVPQLMLEWTPPEGDDVNIPAALTEELTDIGPMDLRFLAASFDGVEHAETAFDDLFADTGELKVNIGQLSIGEAVPLEHIAPETGDLVRNPGLARSGPTRSSPTVGVFYQPEAVVTYGEDPRERRKQQFSVLLIALLVVLACALGALAFFNLYESDTERYAATNSILDRAEALVIEGRYGEVNHLLDGVERKGVKHPELAMRVASMREQIVVSQILAEARSLEERGDIEGAIASYRKLLVRNGGHKEANEQLKRLTTQSPEAPDKVAPPAERGGVDPDPFLLDMTKEEAGGEKEGVDKKPKGKKAPKAPKVPEKGAKEKAPVEKEEAKAEEPPRKRVWRPSKNTSRDVPKNSPTDKPPGKEEKKTIPIFQD